MKTTARALSSYLLLPLFFSAAFSIPLFMNNSSASAITLEKTLGLKKSENIQAKKAIKSDKSALKCTKNSKKLSCKK